MYQFLETHQAKHLEMRDLGPQHPQVPLKGKDHQDLLPCLPCSVHWKWGATQASPRHAQEVELQGQMLTPWPYPGSIEVSKILAHFMFSFLGGHQSLTQHIVSPSIQAHRACAGVEDGEKDGGMRNRWFHLSRV